MWLILLIKWIRYNVLMSFRASKCNDRVRHFSAWSQLLDTDSGDLYVAIRRLLSNILFESE